MNKLSIAIEEYKKNTQLKRHHGNSRWYSRKHKLDWKPSVTSVIGSVLNKGIGFEKWLGNQPSYDKACEVRDAAARRGSLVHDYCEDLIGGLSFDIRDDIKDDDNYNMDEIAKYLMSFQKWRYDYNPKPEAAEVKLFHDDIPWSGTFDLIIRQDNSLQMIDYKTGDYYKSHEFQLNMYRILWNKIFPDFPVESIAGLYLKGKWIKEPNYNFKNFKINEDICWKVWDLYSFMNKLYPKAKPELQYKFEWEEVNDKLEADI